MACAQQAADEFNAENRGFRVEILAADHLNKADVGSAIAREWFDQQDFLADLQRERDWAWTIFRPTFVYGFATGNPMNLTTVIAVYAAISRELGLPLRFPGSDLAYRVLNQAVGASLIARASSGRERARARAMRCSTSPTVIYSGGPRCGPTSLICSGCDAASRSAFL